MVAVLLWLGGSVDGVTLDEASSMAARELTGVALPTLGGGSGGLGELGGGGGLGREVEKGTTALWGREYAAEAFMAWRARVQG